MPIIDDHSHKPIYRFAETQTNERIFKMKLNVRAILLTTASIWSLITLSGCAAALSGATNVSLSEEGTLAMTAKHFAVERTAVSMLSFEKGILGTNYQVKVSGKVYNCNIQYGAIQSCKQPGG